jgi:hypothetical protein
LLKVEKKKVLSIIASLGLSASLLTACSDGSLVTEDNYKNYKCDNKAIKNGKIKCKDDSGSVIFVPRNYVNNGQIKSNFVKSNANVKSVSGSKGLGSSRAPSGS